MAAESRSKRAFSCLSRRMSLTPRRREFTMESDMRKLAPLNIFRRPGCRHAQTCPESKARRERRPLILGGLCACALAGAGMLTGCGEEEKTAPAPPPAPPAPAAPAPSALDEAREALYRQLWEQISPLVTDRARVPEFNEPAKVYLEKLNAYYDALAALPPSMERVEVARRVAELTRNLGAFAKAFEAYEVALSDYESLAEADRNAVEGKRLHSSLLNGMGVCLLSISKVADSIPHYRQALEVDMSVLRDLGVGEETELPEANTDPNVSRAVADVLGSYRCLGESLVLVGDLEDARDVYKKGIDMMVKLKHLDVNSDMCIAYVKLHGALGDLESRCGNEMAALNSWAQAAELCKSIHNSSQLSLVKLQARHFLNTLAPLIAEKSRKLQAEANARQAAEEAREAEEARKVAEEAAAAQAAEEAKAAEEAARAAEEEKAAAAAKAEAQKEDRRRRRSRRSRNR